MQTHDTLFTPTEAAVLTGLPLKAVNNAIDKKTVSAITGEEGSRLLDARALVSLSLERRLADRVAPELRRKVFDALAGSPRKGSEENKCIVPHPSPAVSTLKCRRLSQTGQFIYCRTSPNMVSLEGGLLKIDLREPRREIAASLRDLRRARRLVVSDSEILGGDPVFRGTRVPVHLIAELVAQGAGEAELRDGYPRLTSEMIRLAPIYAAAYPLRGRPRKQPWRDHRPVRRSRRRLADITAS